MSKGNTKENQKRIAVFKSKSATLRSTVAKQFRSVFNKETTYRTSIAELGKSLTRLQAMCKQYRRPFRQVVSDEKYGIQMPVRTAYRYISLVEDMNNLPAKIVARVSEAGFDVAATRVAKKVRKLGNRVNTMTSTELAKALRKTRSSSSSKHSSSNPRELFQRDLRNAIESYIKRLDNNLSEDEVLREVISQFRGVTIRKSGLTVVAKAA